VFARQEKRVLTGEVVGGFQNGESESSRAVKVFECGSGCMIRRDDGDLFPASRREIPEEICDGVRGTGVGLDDD
jgi:hypothetical protein